MRSWLLTILAFLILLPAGSASADSVRYSWAPPTTGNPVVEYLGQLEQTTDAGADTLDLVLGPQTSYEFEYETGITYRLRVSGKDYLGKVGPFSEWSDPFVDFGTPGVPGKPTWTVLIAAAAVGLLGLFIFLAQRKRDQSDPDPLE